MKNRYLTKLNCLTLAFLLLFSSFFNSCKKDDFKSPTANSIDNPQHQISNADIEKWAKDNPVVQYLALDWKNAKQTVFKGRQVIKISLLNENRLPTQKSDSRKVDAIGSHTQSVIPSTYFTQHPPQVFLVKDDNDSLHSSLLNFIPDNQSLGFGQEGKWTGKLYEWNMNSDSLFVQETKENQLLLKYIIKAQISLNSENSKLKNETFLGFIGDVFGWFGGFFDNIGYFLGIPGGTNSWWYDSGCTGGYNCTNTWDWPGDALGWIGGLFSGSGGGSYSGGGSNNGGGGYNGGGNGNYDFYGNYLPGYGSGGNNNGGSGGYYPVFTDHPLHGPNYDPNNPAGSYEAQELISILNLTSNNYNKIRSYLLNHDDESLQFLNYLNVNGQTQENKEFIKWAVGYLAGNLNEDFESLKSKLTSANLDLNDPFLVNKLLRVDFMTRTMYPKFSHLIDNMDKTVQANPKVLQALIQFSGMSEQQILADLKPGEGPIIKVKDLSKSNAFGSFNGQKEESTLNISQEDVDYFEGNVPLNYIGFMKYDDQRSQALGFVLALTTLHEYVHYGRYTNNLPIVGNVEFGKQFEKASVGFDADYSNMNELKLIFKIIW